MNHSLPQFEDHSQQTVKTTTCYMCACRCGVEVTLENNKIRFVKGNPDHPVNKGVLCAKGNAAIMKQESPAKLQQPMRRKPGTERGDGEFEAISWDEALDELSTRLRHIRNTDPNKLAFFTGRDQMQALSGLWASQFGTINWAAHGGFCSVNMASAGLYTVGHSFWEFGDPDWDNTKYHIMWGVAEDHASNPIKIGLNKLKTNGAKFVSVNPVRTGYSAIADEWLPIRPGTDGLLALSIVHLLLKNDWFDWNYLTEYTNASSLIIEAPNTNQHGMLLRDKDDNILCWDLESQSLQPFSNHDAKPALFGDYQSPEGLAVKTVMTQIAETYLDEQYAPENIASVCGIDAETIHRITGEIAHIAFKETISIATEWTDWRGRKHSEFTGRPVSMHAMRGISAHSNGFQTCRALHLIQALIGSIDCPGGFRAKAPYPKHIPPGIKPAKQTAPNTPLASPPLGFPTHPEDLVIDAEGNPKRIDKAYSWEAPLANHGMMHMVIANAVNKDPYGIDTLMLFMANMAWNSSMNTAETIEMLKRKEDDGKTYKIPHIVVIDAFHSETVNFADLVLPDTTYLERFDVISLLDRPISEPDAVCDSIRQPVITPDRDVRPWQEVLIDIGTRINLPVFTHDDGTAKFSGYQDFINRWEKAPGIGFLGGWRGKDGTESLRGEPHPDQWQRYIDNGCFYEHKLEPEQLYYKFANQSYLDWAHSVGLVERTDPIIMELYSETLQRFRLAGEGLYDGPQPKRDVDKDRLKQYFTPLPIWYAPIEDAYSDEDEYPLHAVNQRPMFMYHSWDSQNAWLRQIKAQNYLYINPKTGEKYQLIDEGWAWVKSLHGEIKVQIKFMEGCQLNTVWTWNAIGKRAGAWGLSADAPESKKGFLMNHLITELLPEKSGVQLTNSDPITGQAAWYDLRVNIRPCLEPQNADNPEDIESAPQFPVMNKPLGQNEHVNNDNEQPLRYQTHKAVNMSRSLTDILRRK